MKNNYIRILIIAGLVFLVSCSPQADQNTHDKYKYGVILSEQQGKSELQLYTEDGDLLDTKKIGASGVDENGSAYLNGPQFENENWYVGVASDSKSQDFIIKINPETLTVDKVPANVGEQYQYTGYTVDEDNLYTFYSTPDKGAHIIKTRISSNEVLKEMYIKNSILFHVIPNGDKLILIADSDDQAQPGIYIRIANGDTLEIEEEFKIEDYLFATDVFIKENNLYILPSMDSADTLTNELLVLDMNNGKLKTVEIPFSNARYLRAVDDYFYIIEQEDIDSDSHAIAKLDIETLTIEDTFTFDFVSREVIFEGDQMISSSDDRIYIYNTDGFELIDKIEINNPKDMMFGSLLVKP